MYADYVSEQVELETSNFEPIFYEEALCCKDSTKWLATMQEEMDSLYKNKTWDLVEKPSNYKLVDCKCVYKIKEDGIKGGDKRYKARLVAKTFIQKEWIDYKYIFSPVVKYTSIRILFALVSQFNLKLKQLDVATALLFGTLDETIYMTQPKGVESKKKKNLVRLLKKNAHMAWNRPLDNDVEDLTLL